MKKLPVLLLLGLLTVLSVSCTPPEGTSEISSPDTVETTAAPSETKSDAISHEAESTAPDGETTNGATAVQTPYQVEGSYTVASESAFPVTVRIGSECHTETLRVAVIAHAERGTETYMDVVNAEGTVLCKKLLGGYAKVFLKDMGEDAAATIAVFQYARKKGASGSPMGMTLTLHFLDLSDYLYDSMGTQTGELGFRYYKTLKNVGGTYSCDEIGRQYAAQMLVEMAYTLVDHASGARMVLDSFEHEAYTGYTQEALDESQARTVLTREMLEAAYNRAMEEP